MLGRMVLLSMYVGNEKFKKYVDRLARDKKLTTDQALNHRLVQMYAEKIRQKK